MVLKIKIKNSLCIKSAKKNTSIRDVSFATSVSYSYEVKFFFNVRMLKFHINRFIKPLFFPRNPRDLSSLKSNIISYHSVHLKMIIFSVSQGPKIILFSNQLYFSPVRRLPNNISTYHRLLDTHETVAMSIFKNYTEV